MDSLSALDGIDHGFLTRQGGVSTGLCASLNCGFGAADDPESVMENRRIALRRLGSAPRALVTAYQVHSADVVTVDTPWDREASPHADALVTNRPGICLGILTADCVPVLFADPRAGVIGAAHAGWKGALGGVLEATVRAMAALGATPEKIRAGIGPAIQQASYEVGPEFPGRFENGDPAALRFFVPSIRRGHFMFDLPGFVARRLERLGLASIEDAGLDTCVDEARFFSFRRATWRREADYGRMLTAIALR